MLQHRLLTRDNPVPLETREAPTTFDPNTNTVRAVIASTTPVRRRDARGEYLEILDPAGLDIAASRGASVLDSHQQRGINAILGTLADVSVDPETVQGGIRFSSRPEVAPIIRDVADGIIRFLSVGYDVAEWREGTDASGRRTRTAVKWTIREVSLVSVPADQRARTRSHNPAPSNRAAINPQIRTLFVEAGAPSTLADLAIDQEASIEEARSMLFNHLATRGRASSIRTSVGMDYTDPQVQNRTIGDALYARLSGTAPSGAARELAHHSIIGLMEHYVRANGVPLRSQSAGDIFEAAMMTRAGGLHSTSDFSFPMADTMGRRLGELFRAAQSGASAIVATGTARDFRPITEGRMSSFPSLEPINQSGEIEWGTLEEEGEKLAIASFARAIGVNFQTMVNDDLSAIDRSIRDVAFATAQLKAKIILAALTAKMQDGKALFHADHGNLNAAPGAPSETTLSAGRLSLLKQTPPGSTEPLGLSPSIILVPGELQTSTEKLMAAINPSTSDDVNVFSNKLQIAVEPRLATTTEWYLFCAPGTYPTIRFLTLAGYEAPRFEASQEFSRLGTAYRVHWHIGAGPVDHRGAWKGNV